MAAEAVGAKREREGVGDETARGRTPPTIPQEVERHRNTVVIRCQTIFSAPKGFWRAATPINRSHHPRSFPFQCPEGLLEGCNGAMSISTMRECLLFQCPEGLLEGCNTASGRTSTPISLRFSAPKGFWRAATQQARHAPERQPGFQCPEGLLEGCNILIRLFSDTRTKVSVPRRAFGGLQLPVSNQSLYAF